jgi:hypothetical protein
MAKKQKEFIKNCLKYREFTVPVFHLEQLNERDFGIAWQMVNTLDESCMPFVCVLKNGNNEKELNVHFYGLISKHERNEIMQEIIEMYVEDDNVECITL